MVLASVPRRIDSQQHLLAQRQLDRRPASREPPHQRSPPVSTFFEQMNRPVVPRAHFVLGLAVETLPDQHRPRKERDLDVGRSGIVEGDVDDERDGAVEARAVRNVERFRDVHAIVERKLGDLRVRQKGKFALDLVRKERSACRASDRRRDAFRR